MAYARHGGKKRAAAEAAAARGEGPQPLTAEEAEAQAAAEELELVKSSGNAAGYKGVTLHRGMYQAQIKKGGEQRFLGRFCTPEEAALAYARYVGKERAAAEAAAARGEGPQPLTAEEVEAEMSSR